MAETFTPTVPQDKTGKTEKDGGTPLSSLEQKLLGVIRVQIAEKQKLEAPVSAAKRLAKYCQHLRDENERLKLRAQNYEMGMVRAERRSAQLQNDLYKAQKSGYSPDKVSAQIPFYLPSAVQQLVDSLTAQNVVLMKGLNDATRHPKGAALMEKNIQMQEKIKALEEEIALKSSIISQYESCMSKSDPAEVSEDNQGIIEQKKECADLKMKLRTYQNYIKHLRERNTAIMQSIMQDFEKRGKGPTESLDDDGIADLYDDGAASASSNAGSRNASREGSRNASREGSQNVSRVTSRRESLKDMDVQTDAYCQNAEAQTDSAVSCCSSKRESIDSIELQFRLNLHEECTKQIEDLRDVIKKRTDTIADHEMREILLQERLNELESSYRAFAEEKEQRQDQIDDVTRQLQEAKIGKEKLETELKEAEQIVSMMQEHVENVNKGNVDVDRLKQELQKSKQELEELPMMQQVLKNYEEEIKSYGQERNQLLRAQEKLKKENEQLQNKLKEISNRGNQEPYRAQSEQQQQQQQLLRQQQQQQQQHQQRLQAQRKMFDAPGEPWQNNDWFHGENRRDLVVHDGASSRSAIKNDGDDDISRYPTRPDYERSRSMPRPQFARAYPGQHRVPDQVLSQEQQEDRDYIENGTVKCANCGERFPSTLFQDHFRDCGR